MDDQNKNLILAIALSGLVMLVWIMFFSPPPPVTDPDLTAPPPAETLAATPPAAGTADTAAGGATVTAAAPRVVIDTPRLTGSLSLAGGRIDTLSLKDYRETLNPGSSFVRLLTPVGTQDAYYAVYGWLPAGQLGYDAVPNANTVYSLEGGTTLTPTTPVTLRWDNGQGLVFRRTISVDDNYMFTVQQSVQNTGAEPVRLASYGIVARHGEPQGSRFFVLHEGVVRQSDTELGEITYDDIPDLDFVAREGGNAEVLEVTQRGWVGFTDKYWMTTLIPEQGKPFTSVVKYVASSDIYQVEARMPVADVPAGQTVTVSSRLFAGAKEWEAIRSYEQDGGVYRFVDSIDWGWFFFLTKPIFRLLHAINQFIGNMGWSIIALTFVIKAIVFPLAYKSYVSMAKMKELQPEMEKAKERAGKDRMKLQQEMMALYKREKVNPASGCLPILIQIPIFFSLYKVIFVTIELRHAPWLGPFRDLSSPDPTSIINLFGLLPWSAPEPNSFLALIFIGVLPIILGISMWLQQKLNPTPTDPTQAAIFAWMPWIFMFMLGGFASGLVVYWIANNVITFTQQYLIMWRHGHRPDVFGNIRSGLSRRKKAEASKNSAPTKK